MMEPEQNCPITNFLKFSSENRLTDRIGAVIRIQHRPFASRVPCDRSEVRDVVNLGLHNRKPSMLEAGKGLSSWQCLYPRPTVCGQAEIRRGFTGFAAVDTKALPGGPLHS